MSTTRRRFLQTSAGAASVCLTDGPTLSGLAAFGAEPPPEKVRFGPDLEPIVRLIEETPREQCVRVFVAELKKGLPYRRFLAGRTADPTSFSQKTAEQTLGSRAEQISPPRISRG